MFSLTPEIIFLRTLFSIGFFSSTEGCRQATLFILAINLQNVLHPRRLFFNHFLWCREKLNRGTYLSHMRQPSFSRTSPLSSKTSHHNSVGSWGPKLNKQTSSNLRAFIQMFFINTVESFFTKLFRDDVAFQKRFETTEVVQMTVESNSGVPPFINFVEGTLQRGIVKVIQLYGQPSGV